MPAMTKEQYHACGVKDAAEGHRHVALKPGTWQHAAYNKGWRGEPLDGSEVSRSKSHLENNVPPPGPVVPGAARPEAKTVYVSGGRMAGKSILAAALSVGTQNWPPAAREHARRLIEDIQQEKDTRRRLRLIAALHRMDRRHGKYQNIKPLYTEHRLLSVDEAMSIPMTTQPCPEGPVTVGDILAGR